MELKYSVLMPVYHGDDPDHLITAIDSMINQTVKPEEFFVAVDGPVSDDILWILEGYRADYGELFTLKYYPESRGIALTLRDSLPLCRNEFIARMDADDYSVPERIEKELAVFEAHPEYDWVGSNVDEFHDDMTKPISHVVMPATAEDILKFARRRCPFRQPTLLIRKSAVISSGGYKNVYRYEDYELIMRVLRNVTMKGGAYNIQSPLVMVRTSKDFFKRRGGIKLAISSLKMKYGFLRSGFISISDFIISGFGQAFVALMPGVFIEWFYKKFLRS